MTIANTDSRELQPFEAVPGHLFPLHPRSKVPIRSGWPENPCDDEAAVFHMASGGNVAFRTGEGWGVIDWDPRNETAVAGSDKNVLQRLLDAARMDAKDFFKVRTGAGGLHLYVRIPDDFHGRITLKGYRGIDFKHIKGSYVVAPGSVHPGDPTHNIPPGNLYRFEPGCPALEETAVATKELLALFAKGELPASRRAASRSPADRQSASGEHSDTFGRFTPQQLADALKHFPPEDFGAGADPSWCDLAMASHHFTGGDGTEEFLEWSARDQNYQGLDLENGQRWQSFSDRDDGIKNGLIFKLLQKYGVPPSQWPTEGASVLFADVEMTSEELEGIGVAAAETLPPGVQQLGKATSYSFDALSNRLGDLPPFLDGFFYGNPGGIYVVYGEPKSGKSLLVSSLCLAVAGGDKEWMGRKLWLHGPVRWFALESPYSLIMAGKAWMKRTGRPHPDIRFTQNGEGFVDNRWMDELEMLCQGCRVAVIDTFTMAIPGLDQNSPEAASILFSKLNEVGRRTGTTFIVIHHSTKADGRNARGSNAIIGNSDGSVAVLKEGDGEIRVEAMAVRYGPDGGCLEVAIEQEIIGTDPQRGGQTITGPFLVLVAQHEEDASTSPLDGIAEFVTVHGRQRGDAFAMPRKAIRDNDLEPRLIRKIFECWENTFTGHSYSLDLVRVADSKAQEIIVRCDARNVWRGHRASAMFNDSLLSAEEVSGDSGLF